MNNEQIDPGIILHEIANAAVLIQCGIDTQEYFPAGAIEAQRALLSSKMGLRRLHTSIEMLRVMFGAPISESEPTMLSEFIESFSLNPLIWGDQMDRIKVSADCFDPESFHAPLIETIMRNLIANGIKHAPADTNIRIRVKHTDVETLISVETFGREIDSNTRAKLFTPGGKNDTTGGMGLGLHLSQRCAHLIQGQIHCYSDKAHTVFTLSFPTVTAMAMAAVA